MTFVDIAGYFDVFATFSVILHVVFLFGASRYVLQITQEPVSDHVFFPVEIDFTNAVNEVLDLLFTAVFKTLNPGRTTTD